MNEKKKSVFKNKLQTIRAELMGDIGKTIKTSQEEESTQHIPDPSDSASQSYDRQLLLTLGQQDWEKLKLVDDALRKIETNEFGICEECQKSIPEARLELVPFAQYCVICLDKIEQEKKMQSEMNGK
jgi:DnaK suppressor protein